MNKHLYSKVMESSPDTLYMEVLLDSHDKAFLETHNIYHAPSISGNGRYIIGIYQLRTMFAR